MEVYLKPAIDRETKAVKRMVNDQLKGGVGFLWVVGNWSAIACLKSTSGAIFIFLYPICPTARKPRSS